MRLADILAGYVAADDREEADRCAMLRENLEIPATRRTSTWSSRRPASPRSATNDIAAESETGSALVESKRGTSSGSRAYQARALRLEP